MIKEFAYAVLLFLLFVVGAITVPIALLVIFAVFIVLGLAYLILGFLFGRNNDTHW